LKKKIVVLESLLGLVKKKRKRKRKISWKKKLLAYSQIIC